MTPEKKGLIACNKVDVKCIENNIPCSIPIFDVRYDRVIELNKKLYKVQVKYCGCKDAESFFVNLQIFRNGKVQSKNYSTEDIDALIVYLPETDKLYWFPSRIIAGKTSLSFRLTESRNGQRKGILMGQDYIWECSSVS